ncbi:LLM class flavin-dependent oxidoreductase [Salicibibacter halophilus]|uniref:LLM class flavin-dependent oxidoreductase n=1 Tax=Salicibibacter halophilus TaxID=2502791 RepID=A0A514LM79_9BACI|nr:LLM class flavin-dependent oxidoreductase [Salicibibacter halophilus]QDI92361.1 LLM class flavin-dependent oxidoreductase [Salicibibacter halophilus]
MKLGILEQMPTPKGKTAEDTVKETISLAQYAEQLGYKRFWFAEHHATKGMASSAPEIMMAAVASRTKQMHVGSGGILLPQYSPYKVAAQLLQLQALFPGRIEAGVGRSPGGGERVRSALADGKENQLSAYPEKLETLVRYVHGQQSNGVRATPRTSTPPSIYSLGLGENSAEVAARLGVGYVYGHFIEPTRGQAAHQIYRQQFAPGNLNAPHALTAIFVICGASDAHAEELATSQDMWLLRTEKGLDSRVPSVEEAKAAKKTERDQQKIQENRRRMIIGGPETVRKQLCYLSDLYHNDEWLILTNIHDFHEKRRSFERLISLF